MVLSVGSHNQISNEREVCSPCLAKIVAALIAISLFAAALVGGIYYVKYVWARVVKSVGDATLTGLLHAIFAFAIAMIVTLACAHKKSTW